MRACTRGGEPSASTLLLLRLRLLQSARDGVEVRADRAAAAQQLLELAMLEEARPLAGAPTKLAHAAAAGLHPLRALVRLAQGEPQQRAASRDVRRPQRQRHPPQLQSGIVHATRLSTAGEAGPPPHAEMQTATAQRRRRERLEPPQADGDVDVSRALRPAQRRYAPRRGLKLCDQLRARRKCPCPSAAGALPTPTRRRRSRRPLRPPSRARCGGLAGPRVLTRAAAPAAALPRHPPAPRAARCLRPPHRRDSLLSRLE